MADGLKGSKDREQQISRHAIQALESLLAEAGSYPDIPDRNFFHMIVSSTLIQATHHLNQKAVGTELAAKWIKSHLETLGPLLSAESSRKIEVQVTVR